MISTLTETEHKYYLSRMVAFTPQTSFAAGIYKILKTIDGRYRYTDGRKCGESEETAFTGVSSASTHKTTYSWISRTRV